MNRSIILIKELDLYICFFLIFFEKTNEHYIGIFLVLNISHHSFAGKKLIGMQIFGKIAFHLY